MTRAVIVGTGPSLADQLDLLPRFDGLVFTCNNTHQDVKTDVWLACDPQWHQHFGKVEGDFDKWHWSKTICENYGYQYVEGIWMDGLYLGPDNKISLNHCSGAQLLNLAANHYHCKEIILVGHDFDYPAGRPRHYFKGLSDTAGEYPQPLRKHSLFDKSQTTGGDDLLAVYKRIADTPDRPEIINCTPGSKLPWFPMGNLENYLI